MEIRKTPWPTDLLLPAATGFGERNGPAAPPPALTAPGPDIRPLDLAGALQILVAEVELALTEAGLRGAVPISDVSGVNAAGVEGSGDDLAARALLGGFLGAVPSAMEEPAHFVATLHRAALAIATGSQSAIDRVAAWSGTRASLPEALQRGRELALALIREPVDPPILTHPEWLGLARELSRVRRLRRRQERRMLLTETDADWREEDWLDEDSAARMADEPDSVDEPRVSGERRQ